MNSISEDQLIEYVLGVCDPIVQEHIETGMQSSAELRERVSQMHDVLAVPALSSTPVPASAGLFERIQKSTGQTRPFEGFLGRLGVFLDLPEPQVRALLRETAESDGGWQPSGLPGIVRRPIAAGPRHSESDCALIRMEPGATFPQHGHRGNEWGFVLQGEALQDNGRKAKPGDIVFQTQADTHSFAATGLQAFMFFTIYNGLEFGDGKAGELRHKVD